MSTPRSTGDDKWAAVMQDAPSATTTTTATFKAYNGFGALETSDIDEAVSHVKSGTPGGYVEKVVTTVAVSVVYRDDPNGG